MARQLSDTQPDDRAVWRFFADRRILVTGHTGFKGSWLSQWLLTLGSEVTGLALPPEAGQPNHFHLLGLDRSMNSVVADVRDAEKVRAVVRDAKPDLIFHLAAQPLVMPSYSATVETYSTNVLGTAHVLDAACRESSVQAVVCVTSDKVYREAETALDESAGLGGSSPLGASKAAAEMVIEGYQHHAYQHWLATTYNHQTPIAAARAGNTIGGGDWTADRLLPDILAALTAGSDIYLRNPWAVRSWQHVLDVLAGYLTLAAHLATDPKSHSRAYNFGPDPTDCVDVQTVAKLALDCWPDTGSAIRRSASPFVEQPILLVDSQLARHSLGWSNRWPVSRSVQETVSWQRWFEGGADVRELTTNQITSYMNSAPTPEPLPA